MKKLVFSILVTALVCGCGPEKAPKTISPLPSGLDASSLTDCTVHAAFTSDDFRWMGGNLTMKVFSEDIYDAVELQQMESGDTLIYDGEKIVVESVVNEGDVITVNGGIENGGAWLQPNDGGTYRAFQWDDHSIYTELGTVELPLSEDFKIIDCGEDPTDLTTVLITGQKQYLESLKDWRRTFSPLNTRVVIEDGVITEINRCWIP